MAASWVTGRFMEGWKCNSLCNSSTDTAYWILYGWRKTQQPQLMQWLLW